MRKILLLGAVLTLLLSAGHKVFAKPHAIITSCGQVSYTDDSWWTETELKEMQELAEALDCPDI